MGTGDREPKANQRKKKRNTNASAIQRDYAHKHTRPINSATGIIITRPRARERVSTKLIEQSP